jgi:hypothetical protein
MRHLRRWQLTVTFILTVAAALSAWSHHAHERVDIGAYERRGVKRFEFTVL